MITIAVVMIGLPTLFLGIRLIMHAVDPKSYGPAGGSSIYTSLVAGVLYVFGFVVSAMLGCTAGSSDLTDGMFRHAVVTGRSRLALYFARIPAGLAIIVSMVGAGFTIVCLVCSFAAPSALNFDGVNVPQGLSQQAFVSWSVAHTDEVVCSFNYNGPIAINLPCNQFGRIAKVPPGQSQGPIPTQAQIRAFARDEARQDFVAYSDSFTSPSIHLMVQSGLWLLLESTIGFIVGLGLGSLIGQRTVSVILLIVLEVILTPIISRVRIPYLLNGERGIVGIATDHLEPNGLTRIFGSGGGPNARDLLLPESTTVAVCVIVAWLVGWTAIGAWRMSTRDA
jgi:hypothetical protein